MDNPISAAGTETKKLDRIAASHNTHADFDGVLAYYTGTIIARRISGLRVLECGCSTGVMTPMLLDHASELEVVEGSITYAEQVRARLGDRVQIHCMLFEDFVPERLFDAIVFASVLHHLRDPLGMLRRIATWCKVGGSIHITVPNMNSFHRQLGVAMGIAQSIYDTSDRNRFHEQPGRYTRESLVATVIQAGLEVAECFGFFFKPFPHDIMNQIGLSRSVLDGLYKLGMVYPDLACQIYLQAVRR